LPLDLAEAIKHQCALEDNAEARHLAGCVTALLLEVKNAHLPIRSSSMVHVPTTPALGEWGALDSLFRSARTAETKERVLHSMGSFVFHSIQAAPQFLEVLRSGCNPLEPSSTRLACMKALQASGKNLMKRLSPPHQSCYKQLPCVVAVNCLI